MTLTFINTAIEEAFAIALGNGGQPAAPRSIGDNVTLRTDAYVSPDGAGFRVVATQSVPAANFYVSRVKNHGPDTASESDWPSEEIDALAQAHVAYCINQGSQFVLSAGFDADRKIILLNKLLNAKAEGLLIDKPKLVALYAWFQKIEELAVSGRFMSFPKPPHTFEEVLSE
jgi:hypothetical protein